MVEEVLDAVAPRDLAPFLAALADVEGLGPQACLAVAAVLPPRLARIAGDMAGTGARARLPAVAGLLEAHPAAAWATSLDDAPDQQQIVIAVAKEEGRVSPLIVLVDVEELGGAVKDAFFLPDMAAPRLRRELFVPMQEMGLAGGRVDLEEAIALVRDALERAGRIGWEIPSERHQPVVERIERWLARPPRAG
jgi:hypothetical protein